MRRKDREIKDFAEQIKLLNKSTVIRIALVDDNMPYILPMNFGFITEGEKLSVYLHCAHEGKKIDIIRKNNNISFETDFDYGMIKHEKAEEWSIHYASVIGNGKAYIVDDLDEKIKGLDALMERCGYEGKPDYSAGILKAVTVIKIEVESLTAKSNSPK